MSAVVSVTRTPGATSVASSQPSPDYVLVVVTGEVNLREHVAAWDNLARHAAEPNAFYESWALLPALRQFAARQDLVFVLIYQPINAQRRQPLLCGFFPLRRRRLHSLMPVSVLEMWKHLFCYLCIPLLRQGHAPAVLDLFFDWLQEDARGATLWRQELVSGDGAFAKAFTEVCYRRCRPTFLIESYCRAAMEPRQDAISYVGESLAYRHYKDYKRKERLLGERGKFECRVLGPKDDVATWADQFLHLEAKGWKGKERTAMLADPAHTAYFRELVHGAFAQGKLHAMGLFLDDQPLAMKCNFLAGVGSFAFKIAYDESFSGYSPGMLMELINIEQLHQTRFANWMDSCAEAVHPMINRLWLERRVIVQQYVATGRAPGDLLVSLMPFGRWVKRLFRRPTKSAAHAKE